MTSFIPKEKLTAYQRWEVAAFDEAEQAARAPRPTAAETPPVMHDDPAPSEEAAVVLPTAADVERIYAEAQEQGYTAGYEHGSVAAQAECAHLNELMSELQSSLRQLDQQVAEQLLATALDVASQVVRQTLRLKPELILPVVREAITTLHPHLGYPTLFAHPQDAALIRKHLGDQLAHGNWRLIEDDTLSGGGCRVELGASQVDATLETRWRRVTEAMGITSEWLAD